MIVACTVGGTVVRRRHLLSALGAGVVFPAELASAQTQLKIPLVAVLPDEPSVSVGGVSAFEQKLRELGWIDGSTIRFERRVPNPKAQDMSAHAADLVNMAPDVLVAVGTVYAEALAERTWRIPIVFINVSDPISSGFSDGLAKPSRNLTGFVVFDPAMGGKMVQLLKDLKPAIRSVIAISNHDASAGRHIARVFWTQTQQFAKDLNIALKIVDVRTELEIETAIKGMEPGEGLLVSGDQFLYSNRGLIIELAARHKVPAIYSWAGFVTDGGLMAYTSDFSEPFRGAAIYVDQLLRGTKIEALPIQLPTKFALHINLVAARSLGLEIPRELLVQARRVID